jgi:hypothetical protein
MKRIRVDYVVDLRAGKDAKEILVKHRTPADESRDITGVLSKVTLVCETEEAAAALLADLESARQGRFGVDITQGELLEMVTKETGVECYIKGGFLRDIVRGEVGNDIDLRCVGSSDEKLADAITASFLPRLLQLRY